MTNCSARARGRIVRGAHRRPCQSWCASHPACATTVAVAVHAHGSQSQSTHSHAAADAATVASAAQVQGSHAQASQSHAAAVTAAVLPQVQASHWQQVHSTQPHDSHVQQAHSLTALLEVVVVATTAIAPIQASAAIAPTNMVALFVVIGVCSLLVCGL